MKVWSLLGLTHVQENGPLLEGPENKTEGGRPMLSHPKQDNIKPGQADHSNRYQSHVPLQACEPSKGGGGLVALWEGL